MGGRVRRPHAADRLRATALEVRMHWYRVIIESSGTLYFSFQDLDSTKPAGSVRIRTETISY